MTTRPDYTELREAREQMTHPDKWFQGDQPNHLLSGDETGYVGVGNLASVQDARSVVALVNAAPALLAEVDELRAYKVRAEQARAVIDLLTVNENGEMPRAIQGILTDWSRDE
jgi:hypothetical protein